MVCAHCDEPIRPGEISVIFRSSPGGPYDEVIHEECRIRIFEGSVGHQQRRCPCYGGRSDDPPGLTKRDAARAAAALWRANRDPFRN